MPKVSIVIPTHNAEKTLADCLDSALSQTLRDIEVICINDGSTDRTLEIIMAFMRRDSRVHGLSFNYCKRTVFARKMGIESATGDYIMFLDQDDLLLPSACESAVRLITEKNVDILQFGVRLETTLEMTQKEKDAIVGAPRELDLKGKDILSASFIRRLFTWIQFDKIYRAALLKKAVASMPDVHLDRAEDMYMAFFYYYFAESFCSVKDGPFYVYHFSGRILGKTMTLDMFQRHCQFMDALPLIEDFLRRRDDYEYYTYVVDGMRNTTRDLILTLLLTVPDLTRDMLRVAVQYFGPDIIYDFVEKTGLLRVKCDSRMGLIPVLLSRQAVNKQ